MGKVKALLLGSTGWIGQNVLAQRPEWEWTCVSSANYDLEDTEQTMELVSEYDYVIHCAGFYGGLPFNKKYQHQILLKNQQMNVNICKLVKEINPKKFVIVGSACVYPPRANVLLTEDMIGGKEFHPSVVYSGMAKMHLLETVSVLGIDHEFLVVSNAYGPGEHTSFERSHIIGSLINKIKNTEKELLMMGTGVGVRDYIYIKDVAEAICRYAELDVATNSATNISNGVETTVKQIIETLLKHSDKDINLVWGDAKDDGVKYKVLDNSKMAKDIKFSPTTNIEQGLQQTWESFNV